MLTRIKIAPGQPRQQRAINASWLNPMLQGVGELSLSLGAAPSHMELRISCSQCSWEERMQV